MNSASFRPPNEAIISSARAAQRSRADCAFAPERVRKKYRRARWVVYAANATRLIRQHRFDGGPFMIAELVAHESRLLFQSLNSRLKQRQFARPVRPRLQLGQQAIRRGEADAALCVGADATINPEVMVRFSLLSALSTQNDPPQAASKPFSKNRDGFVMAEGAGALVLESYDAAVARGAPILGVVAGCGELTDSFHRTRSSPDGKPIIGCVKKTLADAGMTPEQIDHINAHGTATPENDKMEYLGISAVFGDRAKQIPVSSNKSMVGHTIAAAGTVEAVFSLLTLEHQLIPPTINYDNPDPAIPFDVVGNKARDAKVTAVMSNSFGFGGQNASLILTREPA